MITFLIDAEGQITQRYIGIVDPFDEISGDLAKLLQASTEKRARAQ